MRASAPPTALRYTSTLEWSHTDDDEESTTHWQLVRNLMTAAIDACETAQRLELAAQGRALSTATGAG